MKTAILIIMVFMLALFTTLIEPFTVGPYGNSSAFAMMGGGGGMGGMGSHGNSGISEWMLKMWNELSDNPNISKQQKEKEAGRLRQQIREKRQELSDLVRSPNPDKKLIDEKINEINRLEDEWENTIEGY